MGTGMVMGTGMGTLGSQAPHTATHTGMGTGMGMDDSMRDAAAGGDLGSTDLSIPVQHPRRLGPSTGDSTAPESRSNGDRYDRSGGGRGSLQYQQQQQREEYPQQQQQQQQQSDSPSRRGQISKNYSYSSDRDDQYQHSHPSSASDVALRNTNKDGKPDFYPNDSYARFENRAEGEGGSERAAYSEAGRRKRELSGGNSGALTGGRKMPGTSMGTGRNPSDKK